MIPVRHGKSELCSQYFPAWYLGRHPDHRVVLVSYEAGFAETWGEKTRDVLAEWGPSVFGINVHKIRNAAGNWRIDGRKGSMLSTGTVGGITGRGADLLIIDDPVKSALEANSETYRNRVWDLYTSTIKTRLEPGGIVMIVMARWHQDDLAGRILLQEEARGPDVQHRFDVLRMNAIHELDSPYPDPLNRQPGEALWPWRYTTEDLEEIRDGIPSHWWNALYQQRPTPPGGGLAKMTWFHPVHAMPFRNTIKRCRFWDCASASPNKGSSDPDWTVGALVARDGHDFYVEDIVRVRESAGEVDKLIQQIAASDGPECAIREEQEPGSSGLAIIHHRKKNLQGYNYRGVPARGEKVTRWMPLLVQAEIGHVKMLTGPWNSAFLHEVSEAPYGKHDDQLDAVAGAFQDLAIGSPLLARDILNIAGEANDVNAHRVMEF